MCCCIWDMMVGGSRTCKSYPWSASLMPRWGPTLLSSLELDFKLVWSGIITQGWSLGKFLSCANACAQLCQSSYSLFTERPHLHSRQDKASSFSCRLYGKHCYMPMINAKAGADACSLTDQLSSVLTICCDNLTPANAHHPKLKSWGNWQLDKSGCTGVRCTVLCWL